MSVSFDSLNLYLLVFVRMVGMIALNPLLSRRNVPSMVRTGLALCLTLLIAPTMPPAALAGMDDIEYTLACYRELGIGLVCGFVFQLFYYLLFFVGDYLDVGFGMSMAKIFDPSTNVQMSISGTLLTVVFILYIFATDGHLILIKLFASSFQFIPAGGMIQLTEALPEFVFELFVALFSLIVRMILPFAVAEFSLQMAMGILMKVIPQITIFVINFQLKMGLGMIMLIITVPLIGAFFEGYTEKLFDSMQSALRVLGGG